MTDTTYATTINAADLLSDSRTTINNNFAASRKLTTVAKTAAYTAADDDVILGDASGGAFSVGLPAAASSAGQVYTIKKTDSGGNAVTVDANASETIDGATTKALSAQYKYITIVCDGATWWIIADN